VNAKKGTAGKETNITALVFHVPRRIQIAGLAI